MQCLEECENEQLVAIMKILSLFSEYTYIYLDYSWNVKNILIN